MELMTSYYMHCYELLGGVVSGACDLLLHGTAMNYWAES